MGLPIIHADSISYTIARQGHEGVVIDVPLHRNTREGNAAWTALDVERCPNCPLRGQSSCPAAADLEPVVSALGDVASIARVNVTVAQHARTVSQTVSGEAAARALLGLLMATSGCPIVSRLRPLAVMHLPFASAAETTFRFAALHLLAQYFEALERDTPPRLDLASLRADMAGLEEVNRAFARRMRVACRNDAIPNALSALFSMSMIIGEEAEDGLSLLRPLFERPEPSAQRV